MSEKKLVDNQDGTYLVQTSQYSKVWLSEEELKNLEDEINIQWEYLPLEQLELRRDQNASAADRLLAKFLIRAKEFTRKFFAEHRP